MASIHKGHVLGTAAFLALPIAVLAPRGGSVILVLAAVGVLALEPGTVKRLLDLPRAITLPLAALVAWSVISVAWAVDIPISFRKAIPFAATVFAGLAVISAARDLSGKEWKFFAAAFIAGVAVGLLLYVEEMVSLGAVKYFLATGELIEYEKYVTRYSLNFLNRGIAVLPLIAWPSGLALWVRGRKPAAVILWLAALAIVVGSDGDAAVFGLVFGLATFLLVLIFPNRMTVLAAVIIGISTITAPFIVRVLPDPATATANYPFLSSSAVIRLQIWNFAVDKIADKPFLGWGFEMSRSFSSIKDEKRTVPLASPDGKAYRGITEPMPLHPHNAVLQWWVELGLVGAVLAGSVLFLVLITIHRGRYPPVTQAAAVAMVVGAMATASISYGAWQNWWVSFHLLAAALCVAVLARSQNKTESSN